MHRIPRDPKASAEGTAIRVFPDVLVRVARGRFHDLATLDFSPEELGHGLAQAEGSALASLQDSLTAQIHDLIPRLPDRGLRSVLLKIRRNVFNARPVSGEDIARIREQAEESIAQDLAAYEACRGRIEQARAHAADQYRRGRLRASHALFELSKNPDLRRGLAFSSHSLLTDLSRFGDSLPEGRMPKGLELGLLKYVSRFHAKTSPFSTFTSVGSAALDDGETALFSPWERRSPELSSLTCVRINSRLYRYLLHILSLDVQVAGELCLALNPTVERIGPSGLRFLSNQGAISVVQRMQADEILDFLLQLLRRPQPRPTFSEAREALCTFAEADEDTANEYLRRLIGYGLIEFHFDFSPADPQWPAKLLASLRALPRRQESASRLAGALATLTERTEALPKATPEVCLRWMEDSWLLLKEACQEFLTAAGVSLDGRGSGNSDPAGAAPAEEAQGFSFRLPLAFRFRPQEIFIEDSTLAPSPALPSEVFARFAAGIQSFYSSLAIFSPHLDERDRMAHFLRTGSLGREAAFLDFFEGYCRDVLLPRRRRERGQQPGEGAAEEIPSIRDRVTRRVQWLAALRDLAAGQAGSPEVRLSLESLAGLASRFGEPNPRGASRTAFVQVWEERDGSGKNQARCVLNGYWGGFGRAYSRFLHILEPEVAGRIRVWNAARAEDYVLAENADALEHNANIHPLLMPFELLTPQGCFTGDPASRIPLNELYVRLSDDERGVELRHRPTGKEVFLFDLGFTDPAVGSQLFQVLRVFSLTDPLSTRAMLQHLTEAEAAHTLGETAKLLGTLRVPRVVLGESIVLQRMTWLVEPASFPRRADSATDADYFAAVQDWRLANGLPEEVFVFGTRELDRRSESAKRRGMQDHKPQYISFRSPLFVDLLSTIAEREDQMLHFNEVLPHAGRDRAGFEDHVTEFAFQWYEERFAP